MPQKGQITRHEWPGARRHEQTCKHCGLIKRRHYLGTHWLYEKDGKDIPGIVKCITRKKPEDGADIM